MWSSAEILCAGTHSPVQARHNRALNAYLPSLLDSSRKPYAPLRDAPTSYSARIYRPRAKGYRAHQGYLRPSKPFQISPVQSNVLGPGPNQP
jgi:hypothetical protein